MLRYVLIYNLEASFNFHLAFLLEPFFEFPRRFELSGVDCTLLTETKRDKLINDKTGLTGPSLSTSDLIKDSKELNSVSTFAGSELKATGFGRGLQSGFGVVGGAPFCQ